MALLKRTTPRKKETTYSKYKPYLKKVYSDSCGYCLMFYNYHEVDHFVPWKRFMPHLKNEYSNLVLSCRICNSKACKGDYHPLHVNRTRKPHDSTRNNVHDICTEDIIGDISMNSSGRISGLTSRGNWLISMFNLNDKTYNETRCKVINMVHWLDNVYPSISTHEKRKRGLIQLAKSIRIDKKRYKLLFKILEI